MLELVPTFSTMRETMMLRLLICGDGVVEHCPATFPHSNQVVGMLPDGIAIVLLKYVLQCTCHASIKHTHVDTLSNNMALSVRAPTRRLSW